MKRVAFKTLGCKVNQYETEAMEELFLKRGYERTTDVCNCDVYVVNTCTVTGVSDAKCRQQINRIKGKNPEAIVAVVGCYAQVSPEEIRALDNVDIIIGTKGRGRIVDLVEQVGAQRGEPVVAVENLDEHREFDELEIATELENTRAYMKIQEGCDMFCTYCIIPYARGHIASRALLSILREAHGLSERGFKEIVLTGIHVASYGKDLKEPLELIDIIEKVADLPGIERIRLSSIEPRWINAKKLERLRATGKFCDHFHLSLQSGSDKVLRAMNRKYDLALYEEKMALIRSYFPECGLTTDIIVGFPGETEADFADTLAFAERIGFSKIHIFPYSPREGTPAHAFTGQVAADEKKRRAHELALVEARLRRDFLGAQLGKTAEVLFEAASPDADSMYGYTTNYIRVEAPRDERLINRVVTVRLVEAAEDHLLAECVEA